MRKKRPILPRNLIKGLGEDIRNMVKTNEGLLLALEIIDEIPTDLRNVVIEGLTSFALPEMVDFLYILKKEYGREMEAACNRGLDKLQMKGLDISPLLQRPHSFFKAYATRTRHTGQVTLDIAWQNDEGLLDLECFFLSYNADGINSFFIISEMPVVEYDADRKLLPDMVEITHEEAGFLIKEAYSYNINYMTRPALGRFLYEKYLDDESIIDELSRSELLSRLIPDLDPRELVNTFFYAQRYRDRSFIASIIDLSEATSQNLFGEIEDLFRPELMMVEGQTIEVNTTQENTEVNAYCIQVEEENMLRSDFTFELGNKGSRWLISGIRRDRLRSISEGPDDTPFQDQVYCCVYEILDLDRLFEILEEIEEIREVGELPFGVHLRINEPEEDCSSQGVFFLSGVKSDIVVNGDELVVIARDKENAEELDELFTSEGSVVWSSSHEAEIIAAYTYLSGQYISFADMLGHDKQELLFEDGLRLLTARYVVKDRERVVSSMAGVAGKSFLLSEEIEVFYEYQELPSRVLRAEYVLGSSWITLSAFGDKDFAQVREAFEESLRDCLEFEGIEIKCEGIFEIITAEVKKSHPFLEEQLKLEYLEKWYESKLKPLRGMTPRDAVKSVEGSRLLWSMFKDMKRNEKLRHEMGVRNVINLKQYIDWVESKQERTM